VVIEHEANILLKHLQYCSSASDIRSALLCFDEAVIAEKHQL
jgi:hypothetical protein